MKLEDGSSLGMDGPGDLKIDRELVPPENRMKYFITGAFRALSALVSHPPGSHDEKMTVQTTFGTVGIRGTKFHVSQYPGKSVTVRTLEGEVAVRSRVSGALVGVRAGHEVSYDEKGLSAVKAVARP